MITRSVCFAVGFAAFIILVALAATGAFSPWSWSWPDC